jgi:hypothetical protein
MTRRSFALSALAILIVAPVAYFLFVFNWSYSSGERAGWVQKFSSTGWFCKTWEGELALVSLPGSTVEKFHFTVWDDKVAEKVTQAMGKRVSLQYAQKVGIPTSCFGETRYYVTDVVVVDHIPLVPGVVVPVPEAAAGKTLPTSDSPKRLP